MADIYRSIYQSIYNVLFSHAGNEFDNVVTESGIPVTEMAVIVTHSG